MCSITFVGERAFVFSYCLMERALLRKKENNLFFIGNRFQNSGPLLLTILVVLFSSLNTVGQISFQPFRALPVNGSGEAVAIGDVNKDGLNDVVVGMEGSGNTNVRISVFTQNAQGGLNAPVSYPINSAALRSVSIADVNNDQLKDVIVGYADNIGIFFQNANGTLQAIRVYPSGTTVDGTKCGDLNNDGLTDIGVSHWNTNFIRVFYQTATGFSSTTYPKPTGGYDEIDVGDVNGDGLDDVVFMAGQQQAGVYVYTQNASGGLDGYVSYQTFNTSWYKLGGMAIGDIDNDGRKDVVATLGGNKPNSQLLLWKQNPTTGLLQTLPLAIPAHDIPEPVEIADLNCDGKNEIILAHSGWMTISIYEQNSTGSYHDYKTLPVPYCSYGPYGLAIGDVNNDGRKDIVTTSNSDGLVILYNATLPPVKQLLATLFKTDTTLGHRDTKFYTYASKDTVETSIYRIVTRRSYEIKEVFQVDSIRTDSIVVTKGRMCGKEVVDSSRFSRMSFKTRVVSRDTFLVASIIDTFGLATKVVIYPNPTTGVLSIQLPETYRNKSAYVSLYNHAGQQVLSSFYDNHSNHLKENISALPSGLYKIVVAAVEVKPFPGSVGGNMYSGTAIMNLFIGSVFKQ